MTQGVDIDVRSRRIEELEKYLQKEGISLEEDTENIIDKLISGNLRDIGGLTAIRGFVYQYYVAIYYMIKMLYPNSKDTWWNYVVIEYFDDVTLLDENNVRFIQVKTTRENTGKLVTPFNFYERSAPKVNEEFNDVSYFNSWLDKLFYNYDYFIRNHLKGNEIKEGKFSSPQFEIATNSPFSSSTKLAYTTNSSYDLNYSFEKDDVFIKKLKSKKVGKGTEIAFDQVMMKDLTFYLNKLFIHHMGSSVDLKDTTIRMIMEIIGRTDMGSSSIADYIFERFFSRVFMTTYNDNPNISIEELTFSKDFVAKLFEESKVEGTERLASSIKSKSVFTMFDKVISLLSNEIEESYQNEKIKKELLDTLGWFYNSCIGEFENDPKYFSIFLHKLFEMDNTLPIDTYLDKESFLKKSIEYIVNCLAFYLNKQIELKDAKLLFHFGELNSEKLLFTIYNAQNKKDTISVMNSIATTIQYCDVANKINDDYYCLIIDDIEPLSNNGDDKLAALFSISNVEEKQPKLIEPVQNLKFFNSQQFKRFIMRLKQSDEDSLPTLKDENIIKQWREIVEIQN